MSHRLFSSLVVSSTLLLEGGLTGCGGADSASSSTARGETVGAEESTTGTNATATAVSPTTNVEPAETSGPATAPPVTMASCEGGWHTTKAGPRCEVDTSGVTVCCPSWEVSADNRATECCIQTDAAQ